MNNGLICPQFTPHPSSHCNHKIVFLSFKVMTYRDTDRLLAVTRVQRRGTAQEAAGTPTSQSLAK
jgi:hypothetical protein